MNRISRLTSWLSRHGIVASAQVARGLGLRRDEDAALMCLETRAPMGDLRTLGSYGVRAGGELHAAEAQGQQNYKNFSTRSGYTPGAVTMFSGN